MGVITRIQLLGAPLPYNLGGQKRLFAITFELDRKYLWNE